MSGGIRAKDLLHVQAGQREVGQRLELALLDGRLEGEAELDRVLAVELDEHLHDVAAGRLGGLDVQILRLQGQRRLEGGRERGLLRIAEMGEVSAWMWSAPPGTQTPLAVVVTTVGVVGTVITGAKVSRTL